MHIKSSMKAMFYLIRGLYRVGCIKIFNAIWEVTFYGFTLYTILLGLIVRDFEFNRINNECHSNICLSK